MEKNQDAILAAASNPETSKTDLMDLAKHEWVWVRFRVARNQSTPADVLAELGSDDEALVRFGHAQNPQLSAEVLHDLAGSRDEVVRHGVAKNSGTAVEDLLKLADDESWRVRLAVAGHRNTPAPAVVRLTHDSADSVRSAAQLHLAPFRKSLSEVIVKLSMAPSGVVKTWFKENMTISIEELAHLGQPPRRGASMASAYSPRALPEEMVAALKAPLPDLVEMSPQMREAVQEDRSVLLEMGDEQEEAEHGSRLNLPGRLKA